jgi:hypothetical protein
MEVQIAGWRLARAWNSHGENVGPRAKVCLKKNERVLNVNGRKHFIFGKAFCQDPG